MNKQQAAEALAALQECEKHDDTYPATYWHYEDAGVAVEEHWLTIKSALQSVIEAGEKTELSAYAAKQEAFNSIDAECVRRGILPPLEQPLSGQTAPVIYTDGEMSREIEEGNGVDVEQLKREIKAMKHPQFQCVRGIFAENVPDETRLKQGHNRAIDAVLEKIDHLHQRGLIAALRSPGMVMVPVEPTEEMISKGCGNIWDVGDPDISKQHCREIYRAMIAARPKGE